MIPLSQGQIEFDNNLSIQGFYGLALCPNSDNYEEPFQLQIPLWGQLMLFI